MGYFLVSCYLLAIVVANLSVHHFGQPALVVTAFVLIPFDLVARDALHDFWWGRNLREKMFLLIMSGSILSWFINRDSYLISIASATAFMIAGFVDVVVYEILFKKTKFVKMNASNFFSSITDSVVFPVIAFSSISVQLCVSQAAMKFFGGIVWSLIFLYFLKINK